MGILSLITGKNKLANQPSSAKLHDGEHSLDKNVILNPTDGSITPLNMNWETIKSVPDVVVPTYCDATTSDNLENLAIQKREQAKHTEKAYRSLRSIKTSDRRVHVAHRGYQGNVAANEMQKLESNVQLGQQLHEYRPKLVEMGMQVDRADNKATGAINRIKATYGQQK